MNENQTSEYDANRSADERIIGLSVRLPAVLNTIAPSADDVLARAASRPGAVGDAADSMSRRPPGRLWHWMLAAAVVLAIAVPVATLVNRFEADPGAFFGAEWFVTGPNETATIALRDGSVVKLAPESKLQLEPSRSERRVVLGGHGFFAVAPMKRRPFVIRTPSGEVRVLGTRFDVSARDDDLELVVVEGRVAMSVAGVEAEVRAGQLARVVNGTPLPLADVEDPHELTAWVGQFLAFQATPLPDAAREIMRHYDVRIQVDPALADRTVTAWFSDWSLEEVMTVFCAIAEARCDRTDDVITVHPTRPRALRAAPLQNDTF